jgi:hypothetical protein
LHIQINTIFHDPALSLLNNGSYFNYFHYFIIKEKDRQKSERAEERRPGSWFFPNSLSPLSPLVTAASSAARGARSRVLLVLAFQHRHVATPVAVACDCNFMRRGIL